VAQAGEAGLGGADVAVEPGDLAVELRQAGGAIAIFGALVAFQAAGRQAQGIGRGPLLVRVGSGAQEIETGRQTTGIQTGVDGGLLGRGPRRDVGLTVPSARLVQGDAGSLPFILLGRLLGADLLLAGLALCRQGRELGPRFFLLQPWRFGIEGGEHLSRLHGPAYRQMSRDNPSRHRRGDGMPGLVDFQPGHLRVFIDGHPGAHEPGAPATQERPNQKQAGQQPPPPVGCQGVHGLGKGYCHR
jgi:hypothetical protein